MTLPPPISTLFPYTTLFRSHDQRRRRRHGAGIEHLLPDRGGMRRADQRADGTGPVRRISVGLSTENLAISSEGQRLETGDAGRRTRGYGKLLRLQEVRHPLRG